MKALKVISILVVMALMLTGVAAFRAPARAQTDSPSAEGSIIIYSPELGEVGPGAPLANETDLAMQGTGWAAEGISAFKTFKPYGWGTLTRKYAASEAWVHAPLVATSYLNGVAQKLRYVEFCAKSSNGVSTKPITLDVWNNTGKTSSDAIAWPADNAYHCIGKTYATPAFHQSVGISVKLHFANGTDTITLYKAWARMGP